jgi:hypothetical protein
MHFVIMGKADDHIRISLSRSLVCIKGTVSSLIDFYALYRHNR